MDAGAELAVAATEVLAPKPSEKDVFKEAEDRVYGETLEVIEGAMLFWRLLGDEAACMDDPPEDWVEEYGAERAVKLFRLAKAGLLNRQESPMGLHVALTHAGAVMKARATQEKSQVNQQLNIGTIQVQYPSPAQLYPSREIDVDE